MRAELASGTEVAGFRIERLVGAGGMGAVYLATDPTLKRRVALKVIAPELADDPRFRERFLVEAELAAHLEHPAIVPVYHAGESDGRLFLVMRYVTGGSLAQLLATREPLSAHDVVTLLQPIAAALDAAHEAGLLHRDVKPANILLEEGRAYLADFGLARHAASANSLVGNSSAQLSGTMGYVAPEQIEGDSLTPRSDQYGLACVAFECLTGRAPFERTDPLAVIYAHLAEAPPSASERRSELPRAVDGVLARGLAKRPDQRFESCSDLVEAIAKACGITPVGRTSRRRILFSAAVVAAVVAAVGTAALMTTLGDTAAPPISDPLVVINGSSGKVVDRVAAAGAATAIAAGGGAIWALDGLHGTITKLDPATRAPLGQPLGVSGAVDLAVGDGGLWVSTGSSTLHGDTSGAFPRADHVQEFDPDTLVPVGQPIPLPQPRGFAAPGGELALTPDAIWVVGSDGSVIRVDLASRRATTVPFDGQASGIAASHGAVWALGDEAVWHIDPATLKAVQVPLNPPEGMRAITAGGAAAWAASWGDGALWRIDARPPFRARAINARPQITALAYDGRRVWAASDRSGDVFMIDPATSATRAIRVGGTPNGIAVGDDGSVWVPTPGAGSTRSGAALDRVGGACSDVIAGAGVRPQFLVVSDEPLTGALRPQGKGMADAVLAELRARGFRAGPYRIGFQSCNDATPDGDVANAVCSANAKAYAATPRVLGVVGNYNSDCAGAMLPFLASAPGGPMPLVSAADTSDSLALAGYPNLARVVTTDDTDVAATVVLAHQLGVRRLFLVSGSNGIRNVADVAAGRNGVEFVGREDAAAADLVRRVRGLRADGVLLDINGAADRSVGAAVKALRAGFGARFPIIAWEAFPISALRRAAGPAAQGVYVVSGAPPTAALSPQGQAWVRTFAASRPDRSVTPYAPLAAQATDVLLDAIARSNGTRAAVSREVRRTRVRGGILGDFAFGPDGNLVPRPITVLRIDDRAPPGVQPTFRGAVVDRQIAVGGQLGALPHGIPVTIDEAIRMPSSRVHLDCSSAAESVRCSKASEFHAGQAGAALICPTGGMVDGEFAPPDDSESRIRTLTCSDGSTLRFLVRMIAYADQPAPYLARITWTWVIIGGTARLAKLRGEGLLDETFRFSFTTRTVTGRMSGYLRTS